MSKDETTVLADLRKALYDTATPYMWSDDVLKHATREASAEHSLLFPQRTIQYSDVAANQQLFTIYPVNDPGVDTTTPASAGVPPPPPPSGNADIISIDAVELPIGTPIPEDLADSNTPSRSGASRTTQGYKVRGTNWLRLRNPAAGGEVGSGKLVVYITQTWNFPDSGTHANWNGPNHDYYLLLLLARRTAYQNLAERQFRNQGEKGVTTIIVETGPGPPEMKEIPLTHIAIEGILKGLEDEIKRAIDFRLARGARGRKLTV